MMLPLDTSSFTQFSSVFATLMFIWAICQQFLPREVRAFIGQSTRQYSQKLVNYFSPYLQISFDEYAGQHFNRSDIYSSIQTYISDNSSMKARRMKGNSVHGKSIVLSLAEHEGVTDEYKGVTVWWSSNRSIARNSTITFYPGADEKRFYRLTFHSRHRKLITESYLNYVMEEGKAIAVRKRQRKLFTNTQEHSSFGRRHYTLWSHVSFKHPATFETVAMEPHLKKKIKDDLLWFSKAKDYYRKIGKPWKRGYLLYGPPGTGKSTMVAAIANLLEYDIYDVELTAVKDNTQLRKLLIETKSKSIILIEDIDCSLDLTGQRKKKKDKEEGEVEEKDDVKKAVLEAAETNKKGSKVTLSGLLNFIDGIWSACGEERLIIFTTNFIDKLDPALIRRGRMDMQIPVSYCCFEAFKVLAMNYLNVDSHPLFGTIEKLMGETEITPADVAENLMPKSDENDVNTCLENLILALEKAKEDAKLKVEEEARKLKEKKEKEEAKQKEEEKDDAEKMDANDQEKKSDKVNVQETADDNKEEK